MKLILNRFETCLQGLMLMCSDSHGNQVSMVTAVSRSFCTKSYCEHVHKIYPCMIICFPYNGTRMLLQNKIRVLVTWEKSCTCEYLWYLIRITRIYSYRIKYTCTRFWSIFCLVCWCWLVKIKELQHRQYHDQYRLLKILLSSLFCKSSHSYVLNS